jgi:outer membrane protein assembly factor BamB
VSTSNGQIHCFRSNIQGDGKVITAKTDTNPYPPDELTELYAEAARHIVQQTDISKGYCLVLDSGKGRLVYELAKLTDLKIIGVEQDINNVEIARNALDKAGLYGRVVVHQGSSVKLPYTGYFANLIVSDKSLRTGKLPASAEEVFRLLRPYGGMVALGQQTAKQDRDNLKRWGQASIPRWKVHKGDKIVWGSGQRGKLKGAGEWTHTYAEPGNTACSKDELIKGSTTIQWFGQPGPRHMIDRHHRTVPPLFKDGRLFVPGDDIVFAVDAYNGTIQWQVEIPSSRRPGVPLDCSNMAVDEQLLYVVAERKCYGFDVVSGLRRLTHTMPQLIKGQPRSWGYVAYSGDILFGSACRKGASYSETGRDVADALYGRNEKLVISDYLFAMDKNGGKLLWKYKDGLIVNTTITAGGGRIYFVETHSPKALADNLGRMPAKTLFDGINQYLVALDMQTGRPVYKKKIDADNLQELTYLSYAKDVLILSGSRGVRKTVHGCFYAFDAGTGQIHWQVSHDSGLPSDGGHGEYNRHPTIIDDMVYTWPYAYNLKTGRRKKEWKFDRHGHGCGAVSASAQCLFWRGHNPWMYDLGPEGGPSRLNKVTRPGCWINIIPAGGLVLIPEASSGCTCGYPLQTSIAFAPDEILN